MSAADLAARFEAWWAAPDPATVGELFVDDVVLEQPVVRPIRGVARAVRFFEHLRTWLPELRGEVHRHVMVGDWLFIDWTMHARVGARPFSLAVVDRIRARGGRIAERRAYYDSFGFTMTILGRPRAWWPYARFLRRVLST